jgi:hypothetical protein
MSEGQEEKKRPEFRHITCFGPKVTCIFLDSMLRWTSETNVTSCHPRCNDAGRWKGVKDKRRISSQHEFEKKVRENIFRLPFRRRGVFYSGQGCFQRGMSHRVLFNATLMLAHIFYRKCQTSRSLWDIKVCVLIYVHSVVFCAAVGGHQAEL